jgi:primary-amine oxidase
VELQTPNKTDALSYIDGSGPEPERWVRAVIDHKASEEPYIQDILVGPLPVVNGTTTWSPLEYTHTRKTEGKVRSLEADSEAYEEWLMQVSTSVADITMDLWNASALGLENDTLSVWGIDPYYQEEGRIKRWDTFWGMPEGVFEDMTLLPMGLFFMSDVTGRDPSKWAVEGWYYNGEFYETTDEFRDAYWGGKVEKLKGAVEGAWAQTDRQGKIPPLDTTAPPVMVAPGGARYHVDPESKYVEWMGWSFYVAFNRDSGMSLFDIRYKGQRLVYELGLMEALAHYAGKSTFTDSLTSYTTEH